MIDHEAMKRGPQVEIFVAHHESDGLITKEMHIPAGIMMGKEKHTYSHQSFLVRGQVRLHRDEESEVINAPAVLEIKANVWHTVEALTDTIWLCTHNSDRALHE